MKKIAIVKLTDQAWSEWLQKLRIVAERQGKQFAELPKIIFAGGSEYPFNPTCEVKPHVATMLCRRHYIELVEIKEVEQEVDEHIQKVNRNNPNQRYLCSFCDKEYKMPHHRNNHEEKCKGD
jgi:hypothetical protein